MKSSMPSTRTLRTFRPKNALLPGSAPTANSSSKPPENKRVRSFDISSRAYRRPEATAGPTVPVASGVATPAARPAVQDGVRVAQPLAAEVAERMFVHPHNSERPGTAVHVVEWRGRRTVGSRRRRRSFRFAAALALAGVIVLPIASASADNGKPGKGKGRDKVTLCHKGKVTITVGEPAVKAHLKHGDKLGPCPPGAAPAPPAPGTAT